MQDQCSGQNDICVGPGELRFSNSPNCRLIARDLQSCIAVVVHAPKLGLAALLRVSLNSTLSDSSVLALLADLYAAGATNQDLDVYAISGAASRKSDFLAMRRILWREGVLIKGEEMGGNMPRSIWFYPATGRLIIRIEAGLSTASGWLKEGANRWPFAS